MTESLEGRLSKASCPACGHKGLSIHQDTTWNRIKCDNCGIEPLGAEGELEREYFTRFGDERGGKEWGEYTFTWFNDVGDWKPIEEDTDGWDDGDYADFREQKEYELVNDMLSDSDSDLYGWIENHEYGDQKELYTSYEVLNEDGKKEVLGLLISWEEPEDVEQKIQYYKKEPLHQLEFLGEGTLEPCPHELGIRREEVNWEGDGTVHVTVECDDCWASGEGHAVIEFEDGERWKDEMAAESKKLPPVEKAIDTGIASGATMEGLELALAAEDESVNDLINELIDDVFREFKVKTTNSYYENAEWYENILRPRKLVSGSGIFGMNDCLIDDTHIGKYFYIPKNAISSRWFSGRDDAWKGEHFSSLTYTDEYEYGEWDYQPTEDTRRKVKAYQEKLRKKYALPSIELGIDGYGLGDGDDPVFTMKVAVGKSKNMAAEWSSIRSNDEHFKQSPCYQVCDVCRESLCNEGSFYYKMPRYHHKICGKIECVDRWYWDNGGRERVSIPKYDTGMYEQHFSAEEPSVYYWVKTEMQNRQPLSQSDLDQLLEMVSFNVPISEIKDGMTQAEELGDRPTYIILELAHQKAKFIKKYQAEEYEVAGKDRGDCEDCYEEIKTGDLVHDDGYVLICKKCYSNYKILCEHEACDERFKNKEEEEEHRQESCNKCSGHGWIMTSYTPATYDDPADADGEDCDECGGEGRVCEGFNAESFSAESDELEESKKRTKMSAIRTGLAITTFGIVMWNLWTNKKQERDISDIMAEI